MMATPAAQATIEREELMFHVDSEVGRLRQVDPAPA